MSILVDWADSLAFAIDYDDHLSSAKPPFKVGQVARWKQTSVNRTIYNGEVWTMYIHPDGVKRFEFQTIGAGGFTQCRTAWKIQPGDNGKVMQIAVCVLVFHPDTGEMVYEESCGKKFVIEVIL